MGNSARVWGCMLRFLKSVFIRVHLWLIFRPGSSPDPFGNLQLIGVVPRHGSLNRLDILVRLNCVGGHPDA